jgi:hypothetical protein
MAAKLNERAYRFARELIQEGRFTFDERDDWSEHSPTADEENAFIERHGWTEYAKWHLGIDRDKSEDTKGRYSFPYGDFERAHRCGLLAAESRAAQYDHDDIARAADRLHRLMESERKPAHR